MTESTLKYYNEFKVIIDAQDIDRLAICLKAIPNEHLVDAAKVFIYTYNDEESLYYYYSRGASVETLWRPFGTPKQFFMIHMGQLATGNFNQVGAMAPQSFMYIADNHKYDKNYDTLFIELLSHRKVNWLNKWFNKNWWGMTYETLYKLYELNLVKYDKLLFSRVLAQLPDIRLYKNDMYQYIKANNFLLENDIYSLFEYENSLAHSGRYNPESVNWLQFFVKLIEEGFLDKRTVLNKCLEAAKRHFKSNQIGWFRELFKSLNPSIEDILSLQHQLFELLNHSLSPNVNFAISNIKSIVHTSHFDTDTFLLNIESALARSDVKTGIQTALSIFEKILKENPDLSSQICLLSTNCLLNNDKTIQEKVAKIIKLYGDKNDELLTGNLAIYSSKLNSSAIDLLGDFVKTASKISEETYEYLPKEYIKTELGAPVNYISSWNDLMFQIGKTLKSTDPINAELLFDGIIRLQGKLPADYRTQLQPFVKQAKNLGWGMNVGSIHYMIGQFIEKWGGNPAPENTQRWQNYYKNDRFIDLFSLRLKYITLKLKQGSQLPLLSTPTHTSFRVHAGVLIDRLLTYKAQNEQINTFDFILAISRIALVQDVSIIEKAKKLNGVIRDLILYLISDNPPVKITKPSFLEESTQKLGKYLSWLGNESPLIDYNTLNIYWAIATRTKNPDNYFEELQNSKYSSYPNVTTPFQLNWEMKKFTQKPYYGSQEFSEYKIKLNNCKTEVDNNYLIYSFNYYQHDANTYYYPADTLFLYSFVPNYSDPFYAKMLMVYALKSNLTSESERGLNEVLKILLSYKQNIDMTANLVLATGFLNNAKINRDLSVEVFIQGVNDNCLNVELLGHNISKLLNGNYAPLSRLIDSLYALKGISLLHDSALFILIEKIIAEIGEEIPKNFMKLIELYHELLIINNKQISTAIEQKLPIWKQRDTIKKQFNKLKHFQAIV